MKYVAPSGKCTGSSPKRLPASARTERAFVPRLEQRQRTILVDQRLTGLIIGLTLQTSAAEIYRALIEGTAFGARVIHDRMEEGGLRIDKVVACGGIPRRTGFHADLCGCAHKDLYVSKNAETCALGGAIAAP